MKCHYQNLKDGTQVLIPGCMGLAVYADFAFCNCYSIEEKICILNDRVNYLEEAREKEIRKHSKKIVT